MAEIVYWIVVYGVALAIRGAIIALLWNWVAVGLFNAPVISWAMAVGIDLLIQMICGNFSKKS